jgi:hypothetical protein
MLRFPMSGASLFGVSSRCSISRPSRGFPDRVAIDGANSRSASKDPTVTAVGQSTISDVVRARPTTLHILSIKGGASPDSGIIR